MERILSQIDKLDIVLNEINMIGDGDNKKSSGAKTLELYAKLYKVHGDAISGKDFLGILHKLDNDKAIIIEEDSLENLKSESIYFSSFKGMVLQQAGGYRQKAKIESLDVALKIFNSYFVFGAGLFGFWLSLKNLFEISNKVYYGVLSGLLLCLLSLSIYQVRKATRLSIL